jgi:hypothetical protein
MALLEAITSFFLPHVVMAVPIPQLRSMIGLLAGHFSLLGLDSFPHPRSLCLLQIFLPPLLASISTVVIFLSFSFIYYLPISSLLLSPPFFVSCYFISVPFLPFLYHSNSSPPIPLHLGLVQTLQPPSQFSYKLFTVIISFLF